ncbi:hypothetical protein THMIRHAM_08280 [Thiomicrorhabdus immobilis]|uniref:Uncharacterized protein n=1 Tax=Thiomicrorhabdus immobilis TaxID=2791037 RepID=A0ABN6CVM1_9GAMM|nr:hypothetical protein [Thiomicrorhabdus immobilis]BCN93043.1 hypothetical protein THMIRHAM_08280 [Thiomicrorhabdus immobilis]
MSDIVDDLLQEVEQLEESTQALESTIKNTSNQNQQIQEANNKASSEASLLALEAAKTAQEASTQSHQAAQASIKQAELLKAQTIELNDSNFNWRQSVRNAAKDFQSAKSSFSIMLITSIVFSFIALGAMGYLLYAMQKEQAQFKGEVLDIIATENTLLNKKITLKVDELASVIETMTQRIASLNDMNAKTAVSIHPEGSDLHTDETVATEKASEPDSHSDAHNSVHPETAALIADHEMPVTDGLHVKNDKEEMLHHTDSQTTDSQTKAHSVIANSHSTETNHDRPMKEESLHNDGLKDLHNNTNTAQVSSEEFAELKALVEKVLTQQQTIQAQVQKSPTASGLTEFQVKKLNDISWLIKKQEKTLQAIQARLGVKTNLNLNTTESSKTILNELKNLQNQQQQLQKQMLEMQQVIKRYTEAPKEAAPYSYKAK